MRMIKSDDVLSHLKGSIILTIITILVFLVIGLFYETFKAVAALMFVFTLVAELANYMDMKRYLNKNSIEK